VTIVHDFAGWPSGPLHLAIGVFDGVHVGHQALVRGVAERARAESSTPMAATFDPLPIEVLAPGAPPSALSDIAERTELLAAAGAQVVVVFHFTPEFASLAPDEFALRLASAGQVRRVCVGDDFQFGRERSGNVEVLTQLGARHGFTVDAAAPVMVDGRLVSSTRIRNALLAGQFEDTAGAAAATRRHLRGVGRGRQPTRHGRREPGRAPHIRQWRASARGVPP